MASNVYQFIDLPRIEPSKRPLKIRKTTFKEVYRIFYDGQARSQADRCLECGNPYCQHTCPVSNHIPNWLKLVYEGRIIEAAELSHATNSLPEICGRVCPQERLCEGACTLHDEFGAVTIGSIETYITEQALAQGWRPHVIAKTTDAKKVAVIGAGPAGLACADFLNRNGVQTTVYEQQPEIGGLLFFGIPSFKLDKEVMQRRREIFQELGIDFKLNTAIGKDIELSTLVEEYDAVFLGTGATQGLKANIPNEDANGVYSALPFLIANTSHLLGFKATDYVTMKDKKVVVLGGGDTAMDCVRTSLRQQAKSVQCVYRRDARNMPGSKKEFLNAQEEGAEFVFNTQPIAVQVNEQHKVKGLHIIKTELGKPDASGRRAAKMIQGSEDLIECDAIIIAFGFVATNMPWLEKLQIALDDKGRILTGQYRAQQTSHAKIFAGGDVTRGSDLVVNAIFEGREAAYSILSYFQSLS